MNTVLESVKKTIRTVKTLITSQPTGIEDRLCDTATLLIELAHMVVMAEMSSSPAEKEQWQKKAYTLAQLLIGLDANPVQYIKRGEFSEDMLKPGKVFVMPIQPGELK